MSVVVALTYVVQALGWLGFIICLFVLLDRGTR